MPDSAIRCEVEFLPASYPALRNRRRWLWIGMAATLVLTAASVVQLARFQADSRQAAADLRNLTALDEARAQSSTPSDRDAAVAEAGR
jgi:hypothetical protein